MFPDFREVAYVRDVLWGPAAHCILVTRAMCSRGAPYVGYMGPSVVSGLTTVGVLVDRSVPPHPTSRPCSLPGPAL